MGLIKKKILGIGITTSTKKEILEYVQKFLLQNQKSKIKNQKRRKKFLTIVTPNPEQIVPAQKDKKFAKILNQADIAIPDGIGLAIASRLLNNQKLKIKDQKELKRIPGVELLEDFVKLSADRGFTVGLIGGRGGVAVKAIECLKGKYPGLKGWAIEPESASLQEISEKIKKTNTKMVFVGLGAPKQELFIARLARQFQISNFKFQIIFMSVGGSFDIIAGRTPRAPVIVRGLGLEWLWRLLREPWRWRRQLALVRFILLVLGKKLRV